MSLFPKTVRGASSLKIAVFLLCQVIDDFGPELRSKMPESVRPLLDALKAACTAFRAVYPIDYVGDNVPPTN